MSHAAFSLQFFEMSDYIALCRREKPDVPAKVQLFDEIPRRVATALHHVQNGILATYPMRQQHFNVGLRVWQRRAVTGQIQVIGAH